MDNYGSKWVWIEDKRLPRSDAWLAAEDVDVGDHDAVAAAIERCAGERGGVTTLNLGLVTRGGKDGVGADTARWPYLLRLLLRFLLYQRAPRHSRRGGKRSAAPGSGRSGGAALGLGSAAPT